VRVAILLSWVALGRRQLLSGSLRVGGEDTMRFWTLLWLFASGGFCDRGVSGHCSGAKLEEARGCAYGRRF